MITYLSIIKSPKILNAYKSRELVTLSCNLCGTNYTAAKNTIQAAISKGCELNFCSRSCNNERKFNREIITCTHCNKKHEKTPSRVNTNGNNFCSSSCATTFNNINKKHGTRRSKLEGWLEVQLLLIYPTLEFCFNKKDAIGSELDIYIPSLSTAIELNGIFHYKPIYGHAKLHSIQNNDQEKIVQCKSNGITLHTIDTSSQQYFRPKTSIKFLNTISDIIKQAQRSNEEREGFEPSNRITTISSFQD